MLTCCEHRGELINKKNSIFILPVSPLLPVSSPLPVLINGPETPAFLASHLLFQSYRSRFPIFTSITSPTTLSATNAHPRHRHRLVLIYPQLDPTFDFVSRRPKGLSALKYGGLIETPLKEKE